MSYTFLRSHIVSGVLVLALSGCAAVNGALHDNGAAAPPSQAAAAPKAVVAQSFIIVDKHGRKRAQLGLAPNGEGLALMGSDGKIRASLVITASGEPGLTLYDKNGQARATLQVNKKDDAGLALYDAAGRNRADIIVAANGRAGIVFLDAHGKPVAVGPTVPRKKAPPPRHGGLNGSLRRVPGG